MKHLLTTQLLVSLAATLSPAPSMATTVDDVYPSCGPTGITKACEPNGGSFSAFPGKYTMALTIGSRTFQDKVRIGYITRHPGMMNFAEVISGDFSSPEAKLYSPLINGKISLAAGGSSIFDRTQMSFEIRVTEDGNKFSVYFTATGTGTACSLTGTAYSDAAKTIVFGTFVMTKDTPDCDCYAG